MQEGSPAMVSPRRLGCRSVPYIRNRCNHSVGRNRADGRIRPCRMAEHKGKPTRSIGLWCLCKSHVKYFGQTSVETYYCPLSNRTKCPLQIRVTRSLTTVILETSGGEHSQARCHANDRSKKLNYKQRIAVAKVV